MARSHTTRVKAFRTSASRSRQARIMARSCRRGLARVRAWSNKSELRQTIAGQRYGQNRLASSTLLNRRLAQPPKKVALSSRRSSKVKKSGRASGRDRECQEVEV